MRRLPLVMVCAALLAVITASSMAAAPVKLTVWAMGAEAQKIGEMTAKFEKANPGIRVTVRRFLECCARQDHHCGGGRNRARCSSDGNHVDG